MLAVLPNGGLASGSEENFIQLWNGDRTGGFLDGHTSSIQTLAVLPDGRLASGSWDSTIRLWDVAKRAEIACLDGHSGWIMALAALPDGRLASSNDNTIRLWDVAKRAEIARLEGHSGKIKTLAVLSDGRLVSGSNDCTIRLWDAITQCEISRLEVDAPIHCLTTLGPTALLQVTNSGNCTGSRWSINFRMIKDVIMREMDGKHGCRAHRAPW